MPGAALGIGLALILYNTLLNRWPPFHGRLYVPLNLALSALLVGSASIVLGLDAESMGLGPGQGPGLLAGLGLGLIAAAPMFLALTTRRAARAVADERMAGLSSRQIAYRTTLRVPVGTALTEELAFRGVLFGLLAAQGELQAALWSSLFFGLWHVAPGINLVDSNSSPTPASSRWPKVAGIVALSSLAGLALAGLRIWSGGLAAPFALHATLNSLGTAAAHLALKRTEKTAPRA